MKKKLNALKESLKEIIPQIDKFEKEIENYKELIDKSTINNLDFKRVNHFCNIFISFYEKKKEINGEDIFYFIKSLENALKETDILNVEEFEYFFNKLYEILSNESNDEEKNNNINMDEKPRKQALISDDEQKTEREKDIKNNIESLEQTKDLIDEIEDKNLKKTAPLLASKCEYFEKLDLQIKKQNKSNSNYSKNSEKYQKEIFKLKKQNIIKDKRIIELEEEIKKYKNEDKNVKKASVKCEDNLKKMKNKESNPCAMELDKTEANNDDNTRCYPYNI